MSRFLRALIAGSAAWLAANAAAAAEPTIWFSPNPQSADYRALMEGNWNTDRAVKIFKFHPGNLNETDFLPNTFPEFAKRDGFNRLRSYGLDLAIETGVIKPAPKNDPNPDHCSGAVWQDAALKYVRKVEDRLSGGARVTWLHLDEPLVQTRIDCKVSRQAALASTIAFMRHVKAARPDLRIIEIEPYPAVGLDEMKSWITDLLAAGVGLEGFHLDINREVGIDLKNAAERARLTDFARFVTGKGLRFGIIYFSQRTSSPQEYVGDALGFYVDSAFLRPYLADIIFQSWHPSPDGTLDIPPNLPNPDSPGDSHLELLRSALTYSATLEAGKACPARRLTPTEYLAYYPDVRAALADPAGHFAAFGRKEGRCEVTASDPRYRPVHRFFGAGGHLFTTAPDDGRREGLAHEGTPFRLLARGDAAGTAALYRCSLAARRFVSADQGCDGGRRDVTLGWLYAESRPGTRPLYRLSNRAGQSLVTTNQAEGGDVGFKVDRILGYVP